jgi:hypothetical protein
LTVKVDLFLKFLDFLLAIFFGQAGHVTFLIHDATAGIILV